MLFRTSRLLISAAAFVLLYLLLLAREQYLYERFLQSVRITLNDFPPSYSKEVVTAKEQNRPVSYQWPATHRTDNPNKIPPLIHFIWFHDLYHDHLDVSVIPTQGSEAPKACQTHSPDFEVRIWNASAARELLKDHYEWFLPTYDSYRYPIQRVDAAKYFILFHFGGVYMDLDIACRRALDPLLRFPAWYPKASPFGVNNDLMASRANHPLTALMLEQLPKRDWNLLFPYLTIFWSTGPQFTSDMLKRWSNTGEKDSDEDSVFVLPLEFYSEEYSFFGHSPGGTWHGNDVAVILWLVAQPWVVAVVMIFILVGLSCIYVPRLRRPFRWAYTAIGKVKV